MTSTALPGTGSTHRQSTAVVLRLLALGVAVCLAVDAWVHLHDATDYEAVRTSVLSQATLFRIEGVVAIAVSVALLIRPRRLFWAAAVVVLASALAAVLASTYIDLGQLGILVPDHMRLGAGHLLQRGRGIAVAIGGGKDNDGRFHNDPPGLPMGYFALSQAAI